jgi:ABC-type transporter Mla subunit MlaD
LLRKSILALMIVVGLAALGSLFVRPIGLHRLKLKSCFENVQGLRSGAAVRIAGVEVGTVGTVRPNPQNKNCPAEIEMQLATTYDVQVPNDAVTEIDTEGLLGGSFVNIDATHASGMPAADYSYLKSKPAPRRLSTEETVNAARALIDLYQASQAADKVQNDSSTQNTTRFASPKPKR